MRVILLAATVAISATSLRAQTSEELIARGDSLHDAMQPAAALEQYRAAFDASNDEMLWRFARSQMDVAKQLGDDQGELRDSLYGVARLYAETAVRVNEGGADGHFVLASALGRLSRTKSGRARVRFGKQIYEEAARALALNPNHDGAHHVIGAWHAEVRRLSGLTRTFARAFLGGGFMSMASTDSAAVHLEQAVENRPDYIYHHLELAEVYVDLGRYAEARTELELVSTLPHSDVLDTQYQREARELLQEIRDR